MNERKEYILKWIEKVSEIRPEIGGFPICPYAKNSKFKIIECSASEIVPENGYDVIIYIIEDNFTLDEVQKWVEIHNSRHSEWKFFEDCAAYDTYINDIQTNNGKYNLIIGQPKQKLRKFREILSKTEYYSHWNTDYLLEILEDDIDIVQKG